MSTEYSSRQPDSSSEAPAAPSLGPAVRSGSTLPLEASVAPASGAGAGGWQIRLSVRAEQITTTKQSVVVEQVVLRRNPVEEVVRLEDTVERERLRLETRGDLETTQPVDAEQAEEAEWTRPIRRRSEDT